VRFPPRLSATILIALALLRVFSTFRTFSATTDEAWHVGSGLEVIQYHRYQLQKANPPLPQVVMAIAPYLGGNRVLESGNMYQIIYPVFYNAQKYERNLVLARIGNLLFLLIALGAGWAWARIELGERGGLLALLLLSMQPIVLGYSGLATLDAAGVAGLAVSLLAFARWLRRPAAGPAVLLGAAYGFAIASKFSGIGYVPAACLGVLVWRLVEEPDERTRLLAAVPRTLAVVVLTAGLVVWASYAFTVGTIADLRDLHDFPGPLGALSRLDPNLPLPAPSFFDGVGQLLEIDRNGMSSYFFGESSYKGWWYYFPAAVALKTTLASMALLAAGLASVRKQPPLRRAFGEAMLAALGILMIAMHSNLDLGVRYVLPLYVPLSIAAAASAMALMASPRLLIRRAAVTLVAIHVAVSLAAHPDYFPYFNLLGGRDPSRLLIDSNLDWGQDVLRLRSEVRRLKINHLTVVAAGFVDYRMLSFPDFDHAESHTPARGWVAVGDHTYRAERLHGGWSWLRGQPFRRVGKSIRLFHLP
jgi:4-amino-4-deoxy-L-arabinose transferase-like glycosyltransferase